MPAGPRLTRVLAVLALSAAPLAGQPASPPQSPPIRLEVSHNARSLQPGEVVTLRVSTTSAVRSIDATVAGRTFPLWPANSARTTWLGLVGLDVEVATGPRVVSLKAVANTGESITATHTLDVLPKTFAERHLRVDPRFSDPPASARPRIAQEAARLEAIFGGVSRELTPDVPLASPVPQPSSSPFGSRSFFNRQPRGRHNGVDFPSPAGTPIKAPGHGRVVLVDDLYFTGHTVVIDHGFGVFTLFAHLQRTAAADGDDVARGDVVGYVGATGRATGPHLHWSMRVLGARVDPLSLLETANQPAR